jgi:DNA-binding XRE family transcriptional regulator
MRWEVLLLEPVNDWFLGLCKNDPLTADKVEEALDELAERGPELGRPLVDRLHSSRIHNLKELRAEQRGYQLAQLRKNSRLTQAQVAAAMGISQARVSQIEHGRITELDAVRAYIEALGGTVDVLARVGDWTVKVA